jgi:broad specificity phosphatase PhoE
MIVSFIRHASTSWNEQGRMQGRRDIPLSERGRAQARGWHLPPELAGAASRISSPLCRAVETAELLGGSPLHLESALIEMDWGDWEGLTLDELRNAHGAEFAQNEGRGFEFRPPRGESPREVRDRVQPWLARAATSTVPIVAVTHLGVLRVILATATGWDMTGKPPIRLRADAVHRFAVDGHGHVSIVECNVPLAPGEASGNS